MRSAADRVGARETARVHRSARPRALPYRCTGDDKAAFISDKVARRVVGLSRRYADVSRAKISGARILRGLVDVGADGVAVIAVEWIGFT